MSIKIGVVMDPIQAIKIAKDTTFAMLLEAQQRSYEIHYMEQHDLFLKSNTIWAHTRCLSVQDDKNHWFDFTSEQMLELQDLDIILLRKDPPFDQEYLYLTYLLEQAEAAGVVVINKPQGVRDANEKLFTAWFPQCCPASLVTSNISRVHEFLIEHTDIICKPLDAMGGFGILRVQLGDPNTNAIFELLTQRGTRTIMAQHYIPEVTQAGDKRILLLAGKPVPYVLARIPAKGETRANLAAGGKGVGMPLSERDDWICQQVGPILRDKGLLFVGLDVIGDYLTEINVTSPTCVRELDALYGLNICGQWFDELLTIYHL